jgi:hypothetical protein
MGVVLFARAPTPFGTTESQRQNHRVAAVSGCGARPAIDTVSTAEV